MLRIGLADADKLSIYIEAKITARGFKHGKDAAVKYAKTNSFISLGDGIVRSYIPAKIQAGGMIVFASVLHVMPQQPLGKTTSG